MSEIINTFLISCVPALITGIITYLTTKKTTTTQMESLIEENRHDIERLMKQHEIDIESLKEKHILEQERIENEHKHKLEIISLEHQYDIDKKDKEQSSAAMYGVMGELFTNPQKLNELMKLADHPMFKKK
ncbi:MAG: hypothetical protein PHF63_03665 [Herbinix sp.]|nr:hypothetical protein [Herbinix sp.]